MQHVSVLVLADLRWREKEKEWERERFLFTMAIKKGFILTRWNKGGETAFHFQDLQRLWAALHAIPKKNINSLNYKNCEDKMKVNKNPTIWDIKQERSQRDKQTEVEPFVSSAPTEHGLHILDLFRLTEPDKTGNLGAFGQQSSLWPLNCSTPCVWSEEKESRAITCDAECVPLNIQASTV